MNFGYDWMVIGTIGERVVQGESKNYYHGKIGQCDDWRVDQIEIDGWTKKFVRSDCSRTDD